MCGITGFWDRRPQGADGMKRTLTLMSDALFHRGPDAGGSWLDTESGVGLGHRRLAIVDLSEQGRQPMSSFNGRFMTVFNGEIYNHKDIRSDLIKAGARFRGHSDTEVALEAFSAWGIEKSLARFVGMFAFAIWDKAASKLILARDRMGEKPLYYGWIGRTFVFASELKALRMHPEWEGCVNRQALASFMRHNYVPSPFSIYDGIHKLPQGHFLELDAGAMLGRTPALKSYWSMEESIRAGKANPFMGTDQDAVGEFDRLLRRTISEQMVADVPLGAFLSGGIDSSTIVALMQKLSDKPTRTFTIGFHEKGYDEGVYAKEISKFLGTMHTELYVTAQQALDVIPKLSEIYDEPFADSSQVPTYLVAQMTRQHVTVSLSGDGGDEIMAGYSRYLLSENLRIFFSRFPKSARKTLAGFIMGITPSRWETFFRLVDPIVPSRFRQSNMSDKLLKLAEILRVENPPDMYSTIMSHWKRPQELVLQSVEPTVLMQTPSTWPELHEFTDLMVYLDMMAYLPDDILVKVDRAAMANSLETRAPFLDHRLIEFSWTLPTHLKIRHGQGKWLLRQVLFKYVPREMMERPKKGFGIPIAAWLRGQLRDWAEALLDESKIRNQGFLNSALVRKKWNEHLSGSRNWHYYLWDVLMFQAWLESQAEGSGTSATAHLVGAA